MSKTLENKKIVEVVSALIWDNDKFLICQRPANKGCPLLWEFVGGKVEKEETLEEALARECKEELDIEVKVGDYFMDVSHDYPEMSIHMTLFNAEIIEGKPTMLEHNDMRWITKEEIPNFPFCPADKDITDKIMNM